MQGFSLSFTPVPKHRSRSIELTPGSLEGKKFTVFSTVYLVLVRLSLLQHAVKHKKIKSPAGNLNEYLLLKDLQQRMLSMKGHSYRVQSGGPSQGIHGQHSTQRQKSIALGKHLERSLLPTSVKWRAVELKSTSFLCMQYSFTRLTGGMGLSSVSRVFFSCFAGAAHIKCYVKAKCLFRLCLKSFSCSPSLMKEGTERLKLG